MTVSISRKKSRKSTYEFAQEMEMNEKPGNYQCVIG